MDRISVFSRSLPLILALFLLSPLACREAEETIEDYGHAVMAGPERARITVDLSKIRRALEVYRIEHDGEYPSSLKGLNLELYYPDEYTYDPKTGKVKSKKYPML